MTTSYTCTICKLPGTAEAADDTPARWLSRLTPMIAHDRCADIRREYIFSTSTIAKLCATRVRNRLLRMTPGEMATRDDSDRLNLTAATRRYAAVIARIKRLAQPVWEAEFVEQLMDVPEQAQTILHRYRRNLTDLFTRQGGLPYAD